jgi:hypothetical protein
VIKKVRREWKLRNLEGVPAGVTAFKIAGQVIREMKESGEYKPPS